MNICHQMMSSPVGGLKLLADGAHLLAVLWEPDRPRRVVLPESREDLRHDILLLAREQLEEYFGRTRKEFDLPLSFRGTDFQKAVWNALLEIRNGETWTYQQLAKYIGRPTASRAVGAAVGRNPISIIVPCHRVIGSSGTLTGFAGGLPAKATLLKIEDAEITPRDRGSSSVQGSLALL